MDKTPLVVEPIEFGMVPCPACDTVELIQLGGGASTQRCKACNVIWKAYPYRDATTKFDGVWKVRREWNVVDRSSEATQEIDLDSSLDMESGTNPRQ